MVVVTQAAVAAGPHQHYFSSLKPFDMFVKLVAYGAFLSNYVRNNTTAVW